MSDPSFTNPPEAPSRRAPGTFSVRMDAFLSYIVTLRGELAAMAVWTRARVDEVLAKAAEAATSASAAATSAGLALTRSEAAATHADNAAASAQSIGDAETNAAASADAAADSAEAAALFDPSIYYTTSHIDSELAATKTRAAAYALAFGR